MEDAEADDIEPQEGIAAGGSSDVDPPKWKEIEAGASSGVKPTNPKNIEAGGSGSVKPSSPRKIEAEAGGSSDVELEPPKRKKVEAEGNLNEVMDAEPPNQEIEAEGCTVIEPPLRAAGDDPSFVNKGKKVPEQTNDGISKEGRMSVSKRNIILSVFTKRRNMLFRSLLLQMVSVLALCFSRIHLLLLYLQSVLTTSKQEENRFTGIIFRSLLLQILSVVVLCFSRSEPLLLVWRLSFIICYGCFIWVSFLTESMGRGTVFVYITYGLLLGSWADRNWNAGIGMLIVHVNSHFATGFLGYALAERLQRKRIEQSVFDIPIPTTEEEIKRLCVLQFLGYLTLGIPMSCVLVGMVRLMWYSADYSANEIISDSLVLFPIGLLFGIIIIAGFELRGALISGDQIVLVALYTLLCAVCKVVWPEGVGIVITWVTGLVFSGILGYCLSVLYSFKRMR